MILIIIILTEAKLNQDLNKKEKEEKRKCFQINSLREKFSSICDLNEFAQ